MQYGSQCKRPYGEAASCEEFVYTGRHLADGIMPISFHLTVRSPCCAPCDCRVRMSTSGFNDAGLFASGRAAVVGQLARCTRATQIRRLCSTASAPTWPAAPSAAPRRHKCGRPPHGRTSRCMLEPLMRAGAGCLLCALLVSCIVHAARAHAERRRDAPICAYRVGVPGPKCPDFFRTSVTFSWHN